VTGPLSTSSVQADHVDARDCHQVGTETREPYRAVMKQIETDAEKTIEMIDDLFTRGED
jgi:hypothetical protein